MSSLLVLGLAGVYLIGIAGVVVAGSIVGSPPVVDADLDERLSAVRARRRAEPRTEPLAERILIARQSRRRDDAMKSLHRAVESLERAFTPVTARRMRSDVAAPGSLRSARSR